MFDFRHSVLSDISEMMEIVIAAKALLKSQNINQWQTGYPNADLLADDVAKQIGWVAVKNGQIAGLCALTGQPEACYKIIDGRWLTAEENYAVVHRMAVAPQFYGQGVPQFMFSEIEKLAFASGKSSLRADTHPQNLAMQKTLAKNGFTLCGGIKLIGGAEDGQPRIGYEKSL